MMPPGWPISHVGSSSLFGASILIFAALLFSSQLALAQFTQQGPKLVGREPVGFVASLARPGGNLTGVTSLAIELAPKRLELLQELVPTATSIATTSATHLSSAPPWLNSARGSLKRGRPSLRPRIAIAMAAMGRAHHGWSMPPTVWSGSSRRR